jgi:hypothetical protein
LRSNHGEDLFAGANGTRQIVPRPGNERVGCGVERREKDLRFAKGGCGPAPLQDYKKKCPKKASVQAH